MERGLVAKSRSHHMRWAGLEGEPDGNECWDSGCDLSFRLRKKGMVELVGGWERGGDADVRVFKLHGRHAVLKTWTSRGEVGIRRGTTSLASRAI